MASAGTFGFAFFESICFTARDKVLLFGGLLESKTLDLLFPLDFYVLVSALDYSGVTVFTYFEDSIGFLSPEVAFLGLISEFEKSSQSELTFLSVELFYSYYFVGVFLLCWKES